MKVYVDELPKDCSRCEKLYFNSADTYSCSLLREVVGANYSDCIGYKHKDCPLQSLADYTKQVRNEIVQEIWKEFEQRLMNKTEDMSVIKVANMINSVLDQIITKELNYEK